MGDYDVFLNHCGPDTKFGFMSHLEKALRHEQLKPFLDVTSLAAEAGSHVPTVIRDALEVVKVNVAVVSTGYAKSEYCLNELAIMMKSYREVQKPVIPVFFDVHFNDDLRWISHNSGVYARAFHDHLRFREHGIVMEWAAALRELANICGYSKASYQGEAALIDDVVACVKKHMFKAENRAYESSAAQSYFGAGGFDFRESGESSRGGEMPMYTPTLHARQPTKVMPPKEKRIENSLEYYKSQESRTFKSGTGVQIVDLFVPQCCKVQCKVDISNSLFRIRGVDHVDVDYERQKVTVRGIAKEEKILKHIINIKEGSRLFDSKQDYYGNPRPRSCH